MIIEQTLIVKITKRNKKYYKEKGYKVDTSEILVNTNDLPLQSHYIVDVKCNNCNKIFQKEYKSVSKYKKHYCSKECQSEYKSNLALKDFERRIGGQDAYTYLKREYIDKQKTTRQISLDVYGTKGNSPNIASWIKNLGIELRKGSEAAKVGWIDNEERRKLSSKIMKENISKMKIDRSFMQTKEYKKKQSEIHKGDKNGMFGVTGENHHNWNPNKTHEQRAKERSTGKERGWRIAIFQRDKRICRKCGVEKRKIVAHHINSYDIHEKERYDINNGVTLCEECHKDFHHKYGYGKNTREQFEEFIKS